MPYHITVDLRGLRHFRRLKKHGPRGEKLRVGVRASPLRPTQGHTENFYHSTKSLNEISLFCAAADDYTAKQNTLQRIRSRVQCPELCEHMLLFLHRGDVNQKFFFFNFFFLFWEL
jgi:hypothetical protein